MKAQIFLDMLSVVYPISEDETLTAYKAYAKSLEAENTSLRRKLERIECKQVQ